MQIKTSCTFYPPQIALIHKGSEHLELLESEISYPVDSVVGVSLAVMIHSGSRATLKR